MELVFSWCGASQEFRRFVETKSATQGSTRADTRGVEAARRQPQDCGACVRVKTRALQPLPTIRGDFRRRIFRLNPGTHFLQASSKCIDLLLLLRHGCLQFLDLAMLLEELVKQLAFTWS